MHWAESVLIVAHTVLAFSVHMLTLNYNAHFTFVKLPLLSLNRLVKSTAEIAVLRSEQSTPLKWTASSAVAFFVIGNRS